MPYASISFLYRAVSRTRLWARTLIVHHPIQASGTFAKSDGRGYEKHLVDIGIYCGIAGLWEPVSGMYFSLIGTITANYLTELLNVWQGGMAIQGGVFLGVITGILYCRHHHLDTVHLMDVLAPAIILGQSSVAAPTC